MNKQINFLDFITILSFCVGVYALEIALENLEENREQNNKRNITLFRSSSSITRYIV